MIALGWVTNLFQRGAASMGRINELLAQEPSIAAPEEPVRPEGIRGAVAFEGVWFRYPDDERWVLKDVDIRVEPGKTVAVVGATASGKSTLVRLLPRVYDPVRGRVLLDGVDVREMPLETLRGAVSVVPQDPFLFSMRLGRNIVLPEEAPEEEDRWEPSEDRLLKRAVRVSQLEETLEVLPEGLDTGIGERGVNLSGGQKQRATLARALYRDAPVIVLDDSLSAVDSVTERAILEGLREFLADRTALIVSHRVSAVRDADRIYVLEEGEVVESGTHEQLLAHDGTYARLLERQLISEELATYDGDGREAVADSAPGE